MADPIFQNSIALKWDTFRTVKAAEDTQLAAGTQKTLPVEGTDGVVKLGQNNVAVAVRLKGTDAENDTLSWTIWAYKSGLDAAEYVAHGTATLGVTQTGNTNEFYCDAITITAEAWYDDVRVVAPALISGGGIAKLVFSSNNYEYFKIVIRDIAGGGIEADTAGADILTLSAADRVPA